MTLAEPVQITRMIAALFEKIRIHYYVVGSLASSLYGIPRATADVDLIADIRQHHVHTLVQVLKKDFYVILCLALVLGSCKTEKAETEETEAGKMASERTESVKTHLGGCILLSPAAEAPSDLYQESDVVPTDEYKPFTKKLSVYGIILIGRDDISDDFMRKVAKTIKEMFSQGEGIDAELQKEVLRNMYKYKTVIPFFKGHDHEFATEEEAAWDNTRSQNSICDIIMESVPGQVNEVVEHILHHVTDVGLHYTFLDEWGISKTSKVYQAMQEAIEKEYYIIDQYGERDDEEVKNRVLLQEFAYWVITSAWNLQKPYGPDAEWKIIRTASDLMEMLPQSYELFESTVPKVMVSPSKETLEEFKAYEIQN